MALHDNLGRRLRPKYYVAIDQWVYLTTYDDPVGRAASGRASEAAAVYKTGKETPAPDGAQIVFVPAPR